MQAPYSPDSGGVENGANEQPRHLPYLDLSPSLSLSDYDCSTPSKIVFDDSQETRFHAQRLQATVDNIENFDVLFACASLCFDRIDIESAAPKATLRTLSGNFPSPSKRSAAHPADENSGSTGANATSSTTTGSSTGSTKRQKLGSDDVDPNIVADDNSSHSGSVSVVHVGQVENRGTPSKIGTDSKVAASPDIASSTVVSSESASVTSNTLTANAATQVGVGVRSGSTGFEGFELCSVSSFESTDRQPLRELGPPRHSNEGLYTTPVHNTPTRGPSPLPQYHHYSSLGMINFGEAAESVPGLDFGDLINSFPSQAFQPISPTLSSLHVPSRAANCERAVAQVIDESSCSSFASLSSAPGFNVESVDHSLATLSLPPAAQQSGRSPLRTDASTPCTSIMGDCSDDDDDEEEYERHDTLEEIEEGEEEDEEEEEEEDECEQEEEQEGEEERKEEEEEEEEEEEWCSESVSTASVVAARREEPSHALHTGVIDTQHASSAGDTAIPVDDSQDNSYALSVKIQLARSKTTRHARSQGPAVPPLPSLPDSAVTGRRPTKKRASTKRKSAPSTTQERKSTVRSMKKNKRNSSHTSNQEDEEWAMLNSTSDLEVSSDETETRTKPEISLPVDLADVERHVNTLCRDVKKLSLPHQRLILQTALEGMEDDLPFALPHKLQGHLLSLMFKSSDHEPKVVVIPSNDSPSGVNAPDGVHSRVHQLESLMTHLVKKVGFEKTSLIRLLKDIPEDSDGDVDDQADDLYLEQCLEDEAYSNPEEVASRPDSLRGGAQSLYKMAVSISALLKCCDVGFRRETMRVMIGSVFRVAPFVVEHLLSHEQRCVAVSLFVKAEGYGGVPAQLVKGRPSFYWCVRQGRKGQLFMIRLPHGGGASKKTISRRKRIIVASLTTAYGHLTVEEKQYLLEKRFPKTR